MSLVVLLGGARSGKSDVAQRLAARQERPVVVVVTGEARDDEMAVRIERHRRERPAEWQTVEEPLQLEQALAAVSPESCAVVDCLSLWVANLLERQTVEEVEAAGRSAALVAAARPGPTIAVTNEVGWGIVPANALARTYRDVLGRVNAAWAEAADRALLVVAGRTLELHRDG